MDKLVYALTTGYDARIGGVPAPLTRGEGTAAYLCPYDTAGIRTLSSIPVRLSFGHPVQGILNVRKKNRRKLYDALADVEALAQARQLYEDGLSGMKDEFARYIETKDEVIHDDRTESPRHG